MSRKKKNPTTLILPPFPLLVWDGYAWAGRIILNSWKDFQARLGPYGSLSTDAPSDGSVNLSVSPAEPPPTETSRKQPPSASQANSYRSWLDHEHVIHDRILRDVAEFYNSVAHLYIEAGVSSLPPTLDHPDQLRDLIGLNFIHVLAESKDGWCYIGYQFGCEWDVEHGLGVMTHREEVIAVGGADTAFCPPYPGIVDSASPE